MTQVKCVTKGHSLIHVEMITNGRAPDAGGVMFIHIGTKQRKKSLGESYEYCQSCGGETVHARMETRRWLTVFWIPVFPIEAPTRSNHCQECLRKKRRMSPPVNMGQQPGVGTGEAGGSDIDALRKKVQRGR